MSIIEDEACYFKVWLSRLNSFLTEKFASIDARFDAITVRFGENDLKQDEILSAIGEDNADRDSTIHGHAKRITKLEHRATSA